MEVVGAIMVELWSSLTDELADKKFVEASDETFGLEVALNPELTKAVADDPCDGGRPSVVSVTFRSSSSLPDSLVSSSIRIGPIGVSAINWLYRC